MQIHCNTLLVAAIVSCEEKTCHCFSSRSRINGLKVSHSLVGNDLSEPDTFISQGQREVHERKYKEGNILQHES